MKKLFALLLALMLVLSLAACVGGNDPKPSGEGGDDDDAQTAGWPTEGYGALIPEPDWDYEIYQDDEYRFIVLFENVSLEDRQAYTEKLIEAGFDFNPSERGEDDYWSWVASDYDKDMKASVEYKRIVVEPR